MKKDNWTEDIKSRLKDYECDAPQGLWDGLSETISRPMQEQELPRSLRWIWALPTAALAFAMAIALFIILKPKDAKTERVTPSTAPVLAENSQTTAPDNCKVADNGITKVTEDRAQYIARGDKHDHHRIDDVQPSKPEVQKTADKTFINQDEADADAVRKDTAEGNHNEFHASHDENTIDINEWEKTQTASTSKPHKLLAMNLYGSSSAGDISSTTRKSTGVMALGSDGSEWLGDPEIGIALYNQGSDTKSTVYHHLPIRIGIGISYYFAKNLSVDTGLEGSVLVSDFTDGTSKNYVSSTQKLQYLAIPVNLRWDFLHTGNLNVYAKTGIRLQKCISGAIDKNYVIEGESNRKESVRIDEHPLQFSTHIALGAEYKLWERTGLYAEFEGGYYFDDGTQTQNIYRSRPFNCSLNFGIRVDMSFTR